MRLSRNGHCLGGLGRLSGICTKALSVWNAWRAVGQGCVSAVRASYSRPGQRRLVDADGQGYAGGCDDDRQTGCASFTACACLTLQSSVTSPYQVQTARTSVGTSESIKPGAARTPRRPRSARFGNAQPNRGAQFAAPLDLPNPRDAAETRRPALNLAHLLPPSAARTPHVRYETHPDPAGALCCTWPAPATGSSGSGLTCSAPAPPKRYSAHSPAPVPGC